MSQPPKKGKRIVSKTKYITALGNKAALSSFGVSITLLGLAGLLSVCLITCFLIGRFAVDTFLLLGIFIAVVGGGASVLVYLGIHSIKEARQITPGVPFTRANISDLPAIDSLVRASDPPVQEQQRVLLRAVAHGQDRHEEQLGRTGMSHHRQPDKRIVNLGEYAWSQFKRIGTGTTGLLLMMCSVCFGIAVVVLLVGIVLTAGAFLFGNMEIGTPIFLFLLFCGCGGSGTFCWYMGMRLGNTAIDADIGVLNSRANTANLSAPDSLVRASEKPTQEPQSVLLRAAADSQKTPQEQLVRASRNQETR